MGAVRIEVSISAPLERVWQAWTETEQVTEWFSPGANVEARVGGAFELFFDPSDHDHQSTKGCVFIAVEPMGRLAFTWKGPDQFDEVMNQPGGLTSAVVTFQREGEAVRVSVEHGGWGDGEEWERAKAWHLNAWRDVLGSLKSTLEAG